MIIDDLFKGIIKPKLRHFLTFWSFLIKVAVAFRYECEGRSAGALHGVYHTNENKTYPTIQVILKVYQGAGTQPPSLLLPESDLKLLRSFITSFDIFDYYCFQVVGYKGPAVVVVSCVEDKPPYRTHPHNLVGKDGMCKKGNKISYVQGWHCGINPI